MVNIRTVFGQYSHNIRTIFAQYWDNIHTIYAQNIVDAPQAAAAQEEKLRQRLAAAAELALEKNRQADDKRKQAAKERMKALAARHALVSPMHPFAHRRTLCGG